MIGEFHLLKNYNKKIDRKVFIKLIFLIFLKYVDTFLIKFQNIKKVNKLL